MSSEWFESLIGGAPAAAAVIYAVHLMLRHFKSEMADERKARQELVRLIDQTHGKHAEHTATAIDRSTQAIQECSRAHAEAARGFQEASSTIRHMRDAMIANAVHVPPQG